MIHPFDYTAKPQNKLGQRAFYLTLLLALALGFLSVTVTRFRGVIALLAIVCSVVAMIFFTRYVIAEYTYTVMIDRDGEPIFVVTSKTGKRISTLCRIALADVRKIEREDRKARASHKTPKGYLKFHYLPTFLSPSSLRLTEVARGERAEITVEMNEAAEAALRENCAVAASMRRSDDEDD